MRILSKARSALRLAAGLAKSGKEKWVRATKYTERRFRSSNAPVILMYHGVIDEIKDPVIDVWSVQTAEFRKHLEFLSRTTNVVSLSELLEAVSSGSFGDKPMAVITFDDGLENVHQNALPILAEKKLPFVMSLSAGPLGTARSIWTYELDLLVLRSSMETLTVPSDGSGTTDLVLPLRNREERLDARFRLEEIGAERGGSWGFDFTNTLVDGYGVDRFAQIAEEYGHLKMMSWAQAAEMSKSKVEIACHGMTHITLDTEDDATLEREIRDSRAVLAERLGLDSVQHFCLPRGVWCDKSLSRVRQEGYSSCLGVTAARVAAEQDKFLLPRVDASCSLEELVVRLARCT